MSIDNNDAKESLTYSEFLRFMTKTPKDLEADKLAILNKRYEVLEEYFKDDFEKLGYKYIVNNIGFSYFVFMKNGEEIVNCRYSGNLVNYDELEELWNVVKDFYEKALAIKEQENQVKVEILNKLS